MLKKLKEWLIRKLGGHTQEYVNSLRDTARRNIYKAEALENACERVISWFSTPILRVGVEQREYHSEIAVAFSCERPMDSVKDEMCHSFAHKLMADNLVSFDVADGFKYNEKLLRGTLTVLLPAGYLAYQRGEGAGSKCQ